MLRFILTILIIAVLVLIAGVATGFIDPTLSGQLRAPKVAVTANGGEVPKVGVQTKELVVGTTEKNIQVPALGTQSSTVKVPTIAVKDGSNGNEQQPRQ